MQSTIQLFETIIFRHIYIQARFLIKCNHESSFLESFIEETSMVQLQLLTATVKLFLKRPEESQGMVQHVLQQATEESDNPDLRDRGYVYWRLLSTNPDAAKAVVLAEKPTIRDSSYTLEPSLLDELVQHLGTLASVYHHSPESFVRRHASLLRSTGNNHHTLSSSSSSDEQDEEDRIHTISSKVSKPTMDLLDMGNDGQHQAKSSTNDQPSLVDELFGLTEPSPSSDHPSSTWPCLISQDKGQGIVLYGAFGRNSNRHMGIHLTFHNGPGQPPLTNVAVQFNKSTFGLAPADAVIHFKPHPILADESTSVFLKCVVNPSMVNATVTPHVGIQAAIKLGNSGKVVYFQTQLESLSMLFVATQAMDKSAFISVWKGMDESKEMYGSIERLVSTSVPDLTTKLADESVFYVARRQVGDDQEIVYFSTQTATKLDLLIELTLDGSGGGQVCLKTSETGLGKLFLTTIQQLLQA